MSSIDETGRFQQRRRTRAAIVAATSGLVRDGKTPSINEIAGAADVSRRTIYQYFPTLEHLLLDATAGLLSQPQVDSAIEAAGQAGGDAAEQVTAMVSALSAVSASTLPLGRSLIRLTVESPDPQETPRRGYRRVAWIEKALQPLKPDLDEATYQQLVSAIAVVVGWEALVVLEDVRGLPSERAAEISTWAANALINAALAEPRSGSPGLP